MKWQPISTAPTDGTNCLVYDGEVKIAYKSDSEWKAEDWNGDCCGCEREVISPSYWMPLPEQPKLTQPSNAPRLEPYDK